MRRRLVGGAVLTAVGAGLMVMGARRSTAGCQPLGAGVLAVFLGVALLGPGDRPADRHRHRRRRTAGSSAPSAFWPGRTPAATPGAPRRPRPR